MGARFDRRSFLAGALAGGTGALLAGTDVDPAGAVFTNGKGRNGISTARPKRGGHLNIGLNAEEQGFNPSTGRFDQAGFMYGRTVFDPLMVVTATGSVVPYLAKSVTPNSDFTQWTITLRSGVVFHDGTACDGAALVQNIDTQYKSILTGVALRPLIASYDQVGPLSVKVTMRNPWVTFPFTLAEGQTAFVAAPSMLDAPNGGTANPVGTGPFVFSEWQPNSHFSAKANPHYWRPGLPYLGSATFHPIPDASARAEALQAGTVDMIHLYEPQQIVEFRANHAWSYVDNTGAMVGAPNVNCLMLNLAKPPFNDHNARLALAKAINRTQYARVIDDGVNAPCNGIFQFGSPYYAPTGYPGYDPHGAKALVRKVEARLGGPFTFALNTVAAPTTIRAAEYIQQAMKQVGITMTLNTIQQNELINEAIFGSFQATEWSQFGGISPDLNYVFLSSTTISETGLSINMARNNDARIESSLKAGMESVSSSARVAAFRRVNRYLAQDLPYIWTDRISWALVSRPSVMNWNNPTSPEGVKTLGNNQGVWWLSQTWT